MEHNAIVSSIYETSSGTWKVRWRQFGKDKQKTFKRKIDAQQFQAELFNGKKIPVMMRGIFFEDFCEVWISRHCKVNVEPSTAKDYEQKVRSNLIPYFKGKALAEIDEDDVIKFREWLTVEKKFSPVTVGNLIRHLKLIFNLSLIHI